MSNEKLFLKQLKTELIHDIKKYEEEALNIKNDIPRTFTKGMLAHAKNMVRRIDFELNISHKNK